MGRRVEDTRTQRGGRTTTETERRWPTLMMMTVSCFIYIFFVEKVLFLL